MKYIYFVVFFVSTIFSHSVNAQDQHDVTLLYNVDFKKKIESYGKTLQLNGGGTYIKSIHKLFSCGLYLEKPSSDPLKIIYSEELRIIDLVITSNQFQSQRTIDEIKDLHEKNKELLKSGKFSTILQNIKEADVALPNTFVETSHFFENAFATSNNYATDNYHSYISDFAKIFEDKNTIGDHYRFEFHGEDDTKIFRDNNLILDIHHKEFQNALLNVFIGGNAPNSSLKDDLLSK
ncbi:hypothetical protein MY04_3162 [Flammeovirga sp. MY04]|uniref:chalcone isomerase family protein n=1 Tax=Flammeovirga sp. MY04 TaxID=1191459 RepID=UPI0008063488|nr:chalcone isomerase family protein [Flammeovirga sp. MY04]ANQ50527.1 hypothetical protein MY04_3162 [Flammeovirga sp. MY04]